jgi:poly(3-hydroxybutyrate) depolymerase
MRLHPRPAFFLIFSSLLALRIGADEKQTTMVLPGLTLIENFDTNPGNLAMQLYAPANAPRKRTALVVALHGCSRVGKAILKCRVSTSWLKNTTFMLCIPRTARQRITATSASTTRFKVQPGLERREVASVMQMVQLHAREFFGFAQRSFCHRVSHRAASWRRFWRRRIRRTFAAVSAIGAGGYQM